MDFVLLSFRYWRWSDDYVNIQRWSEMLDDEIYWENNISYNCNIMFVIVTIVVHILCVSWLLGVLLLLSNNVDDDDDVFVVVSLHKLFSHRINFWCARSQHCCLVLCSITHLCFLLHWVFSGEMRWCYLIFGCSEINFSVFFLWSSSSMHSFFSLGWESERLLFIVAVLLAGQDKLVSDCIYCYTQPYHLCYFQLVKLT